MANSYYIKTLLFSPPIPCFNWITTWRIDNTCTALMTLNSIAATIINIGIATENVLPQVPGDNARDNIQADDSTNL
jgi:hypothetical protein